MGVNGIGAVPATPFGKQAMYVSGAGTATVSIDIPRAGTYALDFRAAAEFGDDMSNPLDFYFDDRRVTPKAANLTENSSPWRPGTGFGRDPARFVVYGTVPVFVAGPGRHTFRIVGRGHDNQTTVIDDVRVASTDAIFASRLPSGGQASGQVTAQEYQAQLAAQAKYALAYGLKVVAYEGGWSLGGDFEGVPIQSYAKYRDDRAANAMSDAIDAFYRAGGEINILGTYDQWYLDDAANAGSYPLVRGIDSRVNGLPGEGSAGVIVPGTLPVSIRASDVTDGKNDSGRIRAGEWVSWNIVVPSTGDYRVTAATSPGGRAELFVDGDPITDGASGPALSEVVRMTKGLHAIRVQSTGGDFVAQAVTVARVGGPSQVPPPVDPPTRTPPASLPPPVSAPAGLPSGWRSEDIGGPNVRGGARVENGQWIIQGAGSQHLGVRRRVPGSRPPRPGWRRDARSPRRQHRQHPRMGQGRPDGPVRDSTGAAVRRRVPDAGQRRGVRVAGPVSRCRTQSVAVDIPDGPAYLIKLVPAGTRSPPITPRMARGGRASAKHRPFPCQARPGRAGGHVARRRPPNHRNVLERIHRVGRSTVRQEKRPVQLDRPFRLYAIDLGQAVPGRKILPLFTNTQPPFLRTAAFRRRLLRLDLGFLLLGPKPLQLFLFDGGPVRRRSSSSSATVSACSSSASRSGVMTQFRHRPGRWTIAKAPVSRRAVAAAAGTPRLKIRTDNSHHTWTVASPQVDGKDLVCEQNRLR